MSYITNYYYELLQIHYRKSKVSRFLLYLEVYIIYIYILYIYIYMFIYIFIFIS